MRIEIIEDVATVGRIYKAGQVAEVQDGLARALVDSGKARDLRDSALLPTPAVPEVESKPRPRPVRPPGAKKAIRK